MSRLGVSLEILRRPSWYRIGRNVCRNPGRANHSALAGADDSRAGHNRLRSRDQARGDSTARWGARPLVPRRHHQTGIRRERRWILGSRPFARQRLGRSYGQARRRAHRALHPRGCTASGPCHPIRVSDHGGPVRTVCGPYALHRTPVLAWYGGPAVNLPRTGYWVGMGQAADYRDKLFWWSADYASIQEQADMRITAHRLDRDARPLVVDRVNGARWEDFDPVEPRRRISVTALLHLMEFPSAGCWEVVGHHRDARLTFVVQVGE
jgi:hypothetical protein